MASVFAYMRDMASAVTVPTLQTKQKVFFIDYSGSTSGCVKYWRIVKKVLLENPTAIVYLWDNNCNKINHSDALKHCDLQRGNGGTSPQCFIPSLKGIKKPSEIIIITDGEIASHDVQTCEVQTRGIKVESVTCYIIGAGADLSVVAPFRNLSSNFKLIADEEEMFSGDVTAPIDFAPYFALQYFLDNKESLRKEILMKMLNKPKNDLLIVELIKLRDFIIKSIVKRDSKPKDDGKGKAPMNPFDECRANSQINSIETLKAISAIAFPPNIIQDVSELQKVEAEFSQMISFCSGNKSFARSQLSIPAANRLTRAPVVPLQQLPDEISIAVDDGLAFECPVMLGLAEIALLIKAGSSVLEGVESWLVDFIINNPLEILNHPDLIDKLLKRIDHPIGLEALKMLGSYPISPLTRNPIVGCISLGKSWENTKYTNATLAKIFFGNKLCGNPDLWLSVIYLAILNRKVQYLIDQPALMSGLGECIIWRMKNTNTQITLTGLVVEPYIEKVPTDIALLYCAISPFIIPYSSPIADDDARNRLRSFGSGSKYFIQLIDLLFPEYKYPRDEVMKLLSIYHAFSWMMNQEKEWAKIKTDANPSQYWCTQLRQLIQASVELTDMDGREHTIFVDGCEVHSLVCLKDSPFAVFGLSIPELFVVAGLVDTQKSVGTIRLPDFTKNPPIQPLAKTNYGYSESSKEHNFIDIPKDTLRPRVYQKMRKTHWLDEWKKSIAVDGPIEKQLSAYNYFIKCVIEMGIFPTQSQFIIWLSKTVANRENNPCDTLPKYICRFVNSLFQNYEIPMGEGFTKFTPAQFCEITKASMREIDRIAIENA